MTQVFLKPPGRRASKAGQHVLVTGVGGWPAEAGCAVGVRKRGRGSGRFPSQSRELVPVQSPDVTRRGHRRALPGGSPCPGRGARRAARPWEAGGGGGEGALG